MKKSLSLLLVLVMLIGMMPTTALATGNEASTENPWSGRSAVFVGDSITAGVGTEKIYYQYLNEALGFGSVTAMGIGGSCVSAASDYGHGNQPLIDRYQSIPSADLILIFMGTNDYGHETPLGSPEDTQDGTFYGALNTIIPALIAKHTSSKIVFVTPLHRYGFGTSKLLGTQFTYDSIPNGVGAALGDYVDALKTVCANNGVSVIDLYTECTLDPSDANVRAAYMPDGIHPNASGHAVIAEIMETHLRTFESAEAPEPDPTEPTEPAAQTELVYGNRFASSFSQQNRASSRLNYYLKAGTVITLKNPDVMQWACARTSGESSSNNLGYFPDSQWTDKATAVVAEDGWIGFTFKYRDETQSFDLSKSLSDYISIEEPHVHSYTSTVTAPTCMEQGYTTYTCTCGDSYADDYVDATGHSYENGSCTGCGVKEWDTDGDGVLEILAIGNSFSVDALEYAYQIAQNLGIEEIVIGNLYKGSCTLATHAKNAKNNTAAYAWFYNDNGTWSRDTNTWKDATEKTMGDALQERTWDFVSLQQASGSSGQPDTYDADLDDLIQYVSDNAPGAKLVWHMTWAYQQNSSHSAFPTYGKNQMTMYNAIFSAVQSKIVTSGNFDLIVPNGTAVQNSRTSLLGDTTTIDGYHMSRPYGRYLTSLMFVKAITGMDISDISYMPSGVSAEEKQIAIESVNNAYRTHFAVTESAYQKETVVIPEGYVQQNLGLTALGYWNSSDKNGDHNKIITTADNSKQYYATVQFTREQLPVDSVILLAGGWQYRPEGWITDAVNTNRPVTTTESYVVITEEWWSNYTLRAFNISKAGLSSLSGVTEADICEAFQIYVPTRAHIHTYTPDVTAPTCTEKGYTTYTCECGDSYESDYVDALGHTYKNGICTGCGEEDTDGLDLNGLNVLCLGDSITAGQGLTTETRWTNILASKYGWNLTNKSQGGISLSSYYYTANGKSDVSIAKKAEILKTMTTKPDVIIVWGGHNDTSYRYSPLGTWDDETTDSFKGALKYIAELADEYAPDATLFVLTPLWTTEAPSTLKVPENTTDNNWMFVDAIYEGAEAYGWIPVNMDLCGITPFTKSGLLLDNIHPNEAGTEKIVAYLSAELASYSETSKKETIIFNASAVSMKPGESTTLKAVLSPRSGTGTMTFTWSSSDSSVATVDTSGKITAVAPGTAVITATAPNGISADISVSVVCEHTYEPSVTAPTCTERGYTTYTCECGDSYTSDVVAALGHDFSQSFVCSRCDHVAKVSVLGDSISTYAGFSAVKNAVYPNKTIQAVEDTWWKQVVDTMGAQLLVNNASGGSRVLSDEYFNGNGIREGNYAAYRDRCVNLHDGDEKPDVIFVFMGTNDFSYHVDSNCEKCQILLNCSECTAREDGNLNVCSKCRSISGIYSSFCNLPLGIADSVNASAEVPTSVCEAYAIMLSKMKAAYPNAQIYCMGLLPRVNPYQNATYHDHGQPTAFNAELKKVAENAGARFISLEQSVDNSASTWNTYFGDAVHPTAIGMDKISAAVLTDVLGKEIYTVSSQIVSSAVTMTGESWAMDGAAYEASVITLNPDLQLDVRVIMNGVDVTENVFNAQTGRIYIVEVTGNILITVKTEGIFWSIGTINTINGADADDYKNRIRTYYISVNEGVTVRASNDAEINVVYFDANYKILSANNNTGWIKEWTSVGAPTAAAYIRVVARATSGTNLTTEYSQNVTITCGHVHDYIPTVTAPTCTEQGYTTYTCACGDSYVDDYVDATGHTYENGTCTGCGDTLPLEVLSGGVLRLTQDYADDTAVLEVPAGTKLDLNGKQLKIASLVSFGEVIDSIGGGILIAEDFVPGMAETYLPIFDSNVGGYRFFSYSCKTLGTSVRTNGKVVFGFAIEFADEEAYTLLTQTTDSGLTLVTKLTCGDFSQSFTFSPELLRQYAQLQQDHPMLTAALQLTVTGTDALASGEMLTADTSLHCAEGRYCKQFETVTYTIS